MMIVSMNSLIASNFFQFILSFLVCLHFVNCTLAEENLLFLYNVTSTKYFSLLPETSQLAIKCDAVVIATPSKNVSNTFIMKVKDIGIVLKDENNSIDVIQCDSSSSLLESLTKTFTVTFDETGILQELHVDKTEVDLSVNIKLLIASFLQVNSTKFVDENESYISAQTDEIWPYGNCGVIYDVQKSNTTDVNIKKDFNIKSCTNFNKRFDDQFLTDICFSVDDQDLRWYALMNAELNILGDNVLHNNSLTLEYVTYKPFKASSSMVVADKFTLIQLLSTVNEEFTFEDEYALDIVITKPIYTNVNEVLFKDVNNAKNEELLVLYRSFACNGYNTNIYMDIFERAIICNKS